MKIKPAEEWSETFGKTAIGAPKAPVKKLRLVQANAMEYAAFLASEAESNSPAYDLGRKHAAQAILREADKFL